jgi:hypothetical protein
MDEDYTSFVMNKINLYKHHQRIDEIRNRKNLFLPKIDSHKSLVKSPKRRDNERKIEEENFIIFKRLLSIDHRLPLLSEKTNLNRKYVRQMKKGRDEFNKLENNMLVNSSNIKDKKLMYLKLNVKNDKYDVYNNSSDLSSINPNNSSIKTESKNNKVMKLNKKK